MTVTNTFLRVFLCFHITKLTRLAVSCFLYLLLQLGSDLLKMRLQLSVCYVYYVYYVLRVLRILYAIYAQSADPFSVMSVPRVCYVYCVLQE